MTRVVRKVIAYIVRQRHGTRELLVFEHIAVDAGVQTPKGTVEPDEAIDAAARREVREETGLAIDALVYLGALTQFGEEWNFFMASVDRSIPDTWEHRVTGKGDDEGMRFRYYWVPLSLAPALAGEQDSGFPLLRARLKIV